MNGQISLVPIERIERAIIMVRGEKVMLDSGLAELYGVDTGALNRAVRRNADRFPADFMFQLTSQEAEILKCQIGISSSGHGGRRRSLPYAFTEQGVAMLSCVLHSPRAVQVNIGIMRAFVKLRQMLASNAELARKLDAMEKKYNKQFKVVFEANAEILRGDVGETWHRRHASVRGCLRAGRRRFKPSRAGLRAGGRLRARLPTFLRRTRGRALTPNRLQLTAGRSAVNQIKFVQVTVLSR